VIRFAATKYSRIALIGFSLGGNLTLKYLGESSPHPAVIGAVAISVPIDLAASARALDQRWSNRIYLRRFMKSLIAKVEAKALRFPDQLDTSRCRTIRTFQEFDDRYTAPIHGFRDAADYWRKSSARQYLDRITVPTLLLNARDDPFLTPECFPFAEAEQHSYLFLEAPESGGHMGFIDLAHANKLWSERRVVEFFATS
jgi:predicted alpha/beta-fold hydrolase